MYVTVCLNGQGTALLDARPYLLILNLPPLDPVGLDELEWKLSKYLVKVIVLRYIEG